MTLQFAVFGNPIAHSKSPRIHQLFSLNSKLPLTYETRLAEIDTFKETVTTFFQDGAKGANITTPFKEQALAVCDQLSDRARLAGAVNTISKEKSGQLFGDNTDGVGLVEDLKRLSMISSGNTILLVGAGGAARGVILPLLEMNVTIVIVNRTEEKAVKLASNFSEYGDIKACNFAGLKGKKFDLIINATASGLHGEVPTIPDSIISKKTACYDMFYQSELTPFLKWAQNNGAKHYADGLGMLVGQAAHAFLLWNNIMPDIENVLIQLRQELTT